MTPTPKDKLPPFPSIGESCGAPALHDERYTTKNPCPLCGWFTKPPKEGPPTLRVIRTDVLVARGNLFKSPRKTKDLLDYILSRLTDEALERDEKRRAALEKVYLAAKEFAEDNHGTDKTWDDLYKALKDIDALTPATQESD